MPLPPERITELRRLKARILEHQGYLAQVEAQRDFVCSLLVDVDQLFDAADKLAECERVQADGGKMSEPTFDTCSECGRPIEYRKNKPVCPNCGKLTANGRKVLVPSPEQILAAKAELRKYPVSLEDER